MPKQDNPLKQNELRKKLKKFKIFILQDGSSGSHNLQLIGYDQQGQPATFPLPNKKEYDRNYIRAIRDRFGLTPEEFYSKS